MSWRWISKIPVIVKWLDKGARKYAEMRTAQEELIKTKEEKEALERMLLKAVQEKYQAEEKMSQDMGKIVREATRRAVHISLEVIKEEYYLIPKKPVDFQDALQSSRASVLGFKPPILGQTHNIAKLPPKDEGQKNADK